MTLIEYLVHILCVWPYADGPVGWFHPVNSVQKDMDRQVPLLSANFDSIGTVVTKVKQIHMVVILLVVLRPPY